MDQSHPTSPIPAERDQHGLLCILWENLEHWWTPWGKGTLPQGKSQPEQQVFSHLQLLNSWCRYSWSRIGRSDLGRGIGYHVCSFPNPALPEPNPSRVHPFTAPTRLHPAVPSPSCLPPWPTHSGSRHSVLWHWWDGQTFPPVLPESTLPERDLWHVCNSLLWWSVHQTGLCHKSSASSSVLWVLPIHLCLLLPDTSVTRKRLNPRGFFGISATCWGVSPPLAACLVNSGCGRTGYHSLPPPMSAIVLLGLSHKYDNWALFWRPSKRSAM